MPTVNPPIDLYAFSTSRRAVPVEREIESAIVYTLVSTQITVCTQYSRTVL